MFVSCYRMHFCIERLHEKGLFNFQKINVILYIIGKTQLKQDSSSPPVLKEANNTLLDLKNWLKDACEKRKIEANKMLRATMVLLCIC